jgi:hypothetical protein
LCLVALPVADCLLLSFRAAFHLNLETWNWYPETSNGPW